uniref:Uncharacterized protein n=1 Tax=Acanthochromis polyacanthus TaxID=80966 RepID=A0A3Q1GX43_9TELE
GRGAMMAASPSAAGGFTAYGLSVRKSEEIADLIDLFSKTQYRAKEVTPRVEAIEKRCLELFARDYKYSVIHNINGEVCGHYPRQIVFLEYECTDVERDRYFCTAQSIPSFSDTKSMPLGYQLLLLFVCVSLLTMLTLRWCTEQRAASISSLKACRQRRNEVTLLSHEVTLKLEIGSNTP